MNASAVRELRLADVEPLSAMLSRAYGTGRDFRSRLQAYLDTPEAARTFVAEAGGVAAGMVVGNDYGALAYVALMAVDPDVQRRGVATRLMDALVAWSEERGFAAVELDATDAGAPLYERFGFVDDGETHVYACAAPQRDAPQAVAPLLPHDIAGLLECDRAAFGADRSWLIERLVARPSNAVFVARAQARVCGYAIAQPHAGLIGPVIAGDAAQARALIDAACTRSPAGVRLSVPAERADAVEAAAGAGFTFVRRLRHMVRGCRPAAERERIFSRVNLGQG